MKGEKDQEYNAAMLHVAKTLHKGKDKSKRFRVLEFTEFLDLRDAKYVFRPQVNGTLYVLIVAIKTIIFKVPGALSSASLHPEKQLNVSTSAVCFL